MSSLMSQAIRDRAQNDLSAILDKEARREGEGPRIVRVGTHAPRA